MVMGLEEKVAYWTDFGFTHYNELFNFQKRLSELRLEKKIPDTILFSQHYPVIKFGEAKNYNKFSEEFLDKVKKSYGNYDEETVIKYLRDLGVDFFRGLAGGQANPLKKST